MDNNCGLYNDGGMYDDKSPSAMVARACVDGSYNDSYNNNEVYNNERYDDTGYTDNYSSSYNNDSSYNDGGLIIRCLYHNGGGPNNGSLYCTTMTLTLDHTKMEDQMTIQC